MTTVINTNSTIDAYYDRYPVVDQIYSTGRTGAGALYDAARKIFDSLPPIDLITEAVMAQTVAPLTRYIEWRWVESDPFCPSPPTMAEREEDGKRYVSFLFLTPSSGREVIVEFDHDERTLQQCSVDFPSGSQYAAQKIIESIQHDRDSITVVVGPPRPARKAGACRW